MALSPPRDWFPWASACPPRKHPCDTRGGCTGGAQAPEALVLSPGESTWPQRGCGPPRHAQRWPSGHSGTRIRLSDSTLFSPVEKNTSPESQARRFFKFTLLGPNPPHSLPRTCRKGRSCVPWEEGAVRVPQSRESPHCSAHPCSDWPGSRRGAEGHPTSPGLVVPPGQSELHAPPPWARDM